MEIDEIEYFQEKLRKYKEGYTYNYEPLRIEIKIKPPLYMANPWIHFDSLIASLCMRDALGEDFYVLPSDKTININNLRLPIQQTGELYHASVSIFQQPELHKTTIFKRFSDMQTYHFSKKQQQSRIRTNSGYFKDFMLSLPTIVSDTVYFYCCADKKEIQRLLSNLTHLGKKTSVGGGRIREINITSTAEDYSMYKDGEVMRPIPTKVDPRPVIQEGMRWSQSTYKPPYWDKSQTTLCRMPKNQLVE